MIIHILLALGAIIFLFKYKAPRGFPWAWALALAAVLFINALAPLGSLWKFYFFVVLLACVIVGARLRLPQEAMKAAAACIAIFLVLDALRIIPAPDALSNMGALLRRPYALEHPNNVAAWTLLLPWGPWTVVSVALTQSRGALLGLLTSAVVRYIPRRRLPLALIGGLALLAAAISIRPDTAFDRLDFWREGARLFAAQPLRGWGTGSYLNSLIAEGKIGAREMNLTTRRTGMHTAHNALITLAAEQGLLGLVPFIGFVVSLVKPIRTSENPAKWGVLAFAIQQIVDDQWLHPITSVALGLALGACFSSVNSHVWPSNP